MKKIIALLCSMVAVPVLFASCENVDEVPPRQQNSAKSYKMPDPETLTDEDRAAIEAQEKEFNENAE